MSDDVKDAGRKVSGCANVATAVSIIIWAWLFVRAAGHYAEVAKYGYPDATGRWDFWVYLPLGITLGLLLSALVFNLVLRSAEVLVVLSALALMGVLPYLVMTSGGV